MRRETFQELASELLLLLVVLDTEIGKLKADVLTMSTPVGVFELSALQNYVTHKLRALGK